MTSSNSSSRALQTLETATSRIYPKGIYPYQRKLYETIESSNFTIINKSRQVGVSFFLAAYALIRAMVWDETVLIVSPSERQSKHLFGYLAQILRVFREAGLAGELKEETKQSLEWADGGAVYSLPNSANTVRGITAGLIILDEFAHFLNGTDEEIWEAILPSLSRGGRAVVVSTPFGQRGLFYGFFSLPDKYPRWKRETIHYSECPDIRIDGIKESMDTVSFEQEYELKFIGDVGSYFPYELLQKCIEDYPYQEALPQAEEVLVGVDIGRRADFTAVIGIAREGKQWRVVFKKVMRNTPFSEQEAFLETLLRGSRINNLMIDETGLGMQLAEGLRKKFGVVKPVTFTHEIKNKMVIELKRMIENRELVFPSDMQLINALHYIERKETPNGTVFTANKEDETGHSDVAFALALAVYPMARRIYTGESRILEGVSL